MNNYPQLNGYLAQIAEISGYLWERGWAERNAGNISINITSLSGIDSGSNIDTSEFANSVTVKLNKSYPALINNIFLVTATGSRMRDIAKEPWRHACLIKISEDGNYYQRFLISSETNDIMPTSELTTHLSIHQILASKKAKERVVLHTHPTELIALSQITEIKNEMNQILMGMHPENIIFIPDGIGMVPFILPGSNELADETSKAFERHKVVLWEKHGCIAIGENLNDAFDLIDTLAKSARIYFMVGAAGFEPVGLSEDNLRDLKSLCEKFIF